MKPTLPTRLLLCVFFASLLLAACSLLNQPGGKIDLKDCTVANQPAKCGTLAVYEDRAAGKGRTIDLAVVVFPAKQTPAQPDPLFYLAGGPGGGAASQFSGSAPAQFAEVNQTRDLVYVDQRGTGQSNLMLCTEVKPGEDPGAVFDACLETAKGDPRFYTTALAMDDVDDVRQALGYETVNLYGMSYGVTAAQVYLNRHPDRVRSVILDHGALLQNPFADQWARASQLGLERVFARCAADEACRAAYPNLPQDFESLVEKLKEPVHSGLLDPASVEPIYFTRENFGTTIHYLLMDGTSAAKLPYLVHKAAAGDWSLLAREYLNASKASSVQLRRIVMTMAIVCHEPWWGGSEEAMKALGESSYYLDTALADQRYVESICAALPDPGESAQHGPAQPSDVPVLLLAGEIDPQDNIEGLVGYESLWPNSLLVVQPGVSHNYTPTPCWNSLMAAFVEKGSVEGLPVACVSEVQPPAFFR